MGLAFNHDGPHRVPPQQASLDEVFVGGRNVLSAVVSEDRIVGVSASVISTMKVHQTLLQGRKRLVCGSGGLRLRLPRAPSCGRRPRALGRCSI